LNYIDSLTLENFQSHKKTTINPAGPGQLTVIVGPSDSGKTSVIRGLKWLAFNSPQGGDFIRVGTQQASVTAIMENSERVIRTRSRGGVNRYTLESIERQKPQVYESFGTGVPLEIQQALEMAPISIGDMEFNLNLSEQLDGPFLGNSTPATARAKVLGKLSGVEEVDHAGKTLGTDLYRKHREVEGIQNQIKYYTEKIGEYAYLDKLGPLVEAVDKMVAELRTKIERKKALAELRIKLAGINAAIAKEDEKIAQLAGAEEAERKIGKLAAADARLEKITSARKEWAAICSDLAAAAKTLEETKTIPQIEQVLFGAVTKAERLCVLHKCSANISALAAALVQSEGILEATKDIPAALELAGKLLTKNERLKALSAKKVVLSSLDSEMQRAEAVLDATGNLPMLTAAIDGLGKAENRYKRLSALQATRNQVQTEIRVAIRTCQEAGLAEKKFSDELAELYKKVIVLCPQCGTEINIQHILEEVV
jgi:exonuclease SbcC